MLDKEQDGFAVASEKKEELLGDRLLKNYSTNIDAFHDEGSDSEYLFRALYDRDRQETPDLDMATWAKSTGMDRFLESGKKLEMERKQFKLDNAEREKNLAEKGDFMRGAAAGVDQMQATVGGGSLMLLGKLASYAGGDNVVSKYLTNKGFDVYQEQMRQASLNPTKSLLSDKEGQWINDELQGPGDYFDAIAGTLGNLAPSMAVSLISGGVGGKLAELAGRKAVDKTVGFFVKNQAERMMNKGMFDKLAAASTETAVRAGVGLEAATLAGTEAARKVAQVAAQKYVGSRVGVILGTGVLESSGAFSETVDHMRQKFLDQGMAPEEALLKATDETSATFAMSTGLAAGMVEIMGGNMRLVDMVLGDVGGKTAKELIKAASHARANPGLRGKALNMMRDIMTEAVKQAPAEFGQEAVQEILSMSNVDFADPDFQMVSQENFKRVLESGLAGAIGGAGGGFATQVGSKAKAAFGTQETPESRAKDLDVIIKRQESIIALGQEKSLPGVTAALEANRAERAELAKHLGNVSAGVSYQDAVAKIETELPNPSGKPFTVKALKNLVRHGNLEELEKGTIRAEALENYITARKPAPNATTSTSQTSQSTVDPGATIDPATGQPSATIDPATGQPSATIDPATGQPSATIDPATGQQTIDQDMTDDDALAKAWAERIENADSEEEAAALADQWARDLAAEEEAKTAAGRGQSSPSTPILLESHPERQKDKNDKEHARSRYEERNGIGYSVYLNEENGSEDIFMSAFGDNDFVAYTRVYEDGKPTNKFTSKAERQTERAGATKEMVAGAAAMLPEGHQLLENDTISTDGMKHFENQLRNGYTPSIGQDGKIETSTARLSNAGKTSLLEDVETSFENMEVKTRAQFDQVKQQVAPYLAKLGLDPETSISWDGTNVLIEMPVLNSKTAATQEATGQQEPPSQEELPIIDPETGLPVESWTPERLAAKFGTKDEPPKFSRATVDFEGPGLGRDRISEHVAKAGLSEVSTIFESLDELAPETRAAVEAKEGQNSPAFWHGGRLHVNAARVRDDDHMADIMSHEIIHPAEEAHVAELAKKMGAEAAVNEWNGTLDQVYSSFTPEIEKMATERGYDKDYDLATEVGRRGIAGELLADRNIKGTEKFYDKAVVVLKKIVNAVRKTLGLKEMDLGESEVRVLLSKMKGSLEKQGVTGVQAIAPKFSRGKIDAFNLPPLDKTKTIAEQKADADAYAKGLEETQAFLKDTSAKVTRHIRAMGGISTESILDFIGESQTDQVKELKRKFGAGVIVDGAKFGLDQVASNLTEKMGHLELNGESQALYDLLSDKLLSQNEITRQYSSSMAALKMDAKRLDSAEAKMQHQREISEKSRKPAPAAKPVPAAKPAPAPVSPAARPATATRSAPKTLPRMPMYMEHNEADHKMRPDLLNRKNPITSTIDAIWEGFRTATTRTVMQVVDQLKLDIKKPRAKITIADLKQAVGRQFYVEEKGKRVVLRVTEVVPVNEMTAEEWSQREGWAPEQFAKFIGEGRERMHGLKEVSHTKVTREVPNVKAVELEDDAGQTLMPDGTSEMKEVKRETPLPMEYVQIRYEVVSKTEVGLPDAGLSTDQQIDLIPAAPAPLAAKAEATQNYTEDMQAEDDAAVAADAAAVKESAKEAPGVIHEKNKTATATKPAPLEKPGFAKSDEHLLWLFNQQYRTEPLTEKSMSMLRTLYNNIFRKDHLVRVAPEWAGFPDGDPKFFTHVIPAAYVDYSADFAKVLDNFMWLEANAEDKASLKELRILREKQLAAIKKENALNYLAHLLSVEDKKKESKDQAVGLRQGDDPFKGEVDENGKPIPKSNALNDRMVGKYENYKAAYDKLAANISLEEQALLHAERLSRLRALPMAKKVRLIVSSRPDDFISGIRDGVEYLHNAAKTLRSELKEGNLASIYSGDLNKFLSAAWSLLTTQGTARSESYGKEITAIREKYKALYEDVPSLPTQEIREAEYKRLRGEKKAELAEARKKSNDEYKALLDGMLAQVNLAVAPVMDKEGRVNKALYSAHGKDMNLFVGGLKEDLKQMKAYVDNISNTRALLQFGTLPYSSDRDVKVPTSLEILQHSTVDVRGQIPAKNYGKVEAYIRETVGAIQKGMSKWNALNRLGADTKAIYADLISRMMGVFAYSGRLDGDAATRNDIRARQLALTSLLSSAQGTVVLEDALRFSAALSSLHEDKKGMSDSARNAMLEDFAIAAVLGRTEMTKPSLSGKSAFLKDYQNVGDLAQALRSAHARATGLLASFGVIAGTERANALSFPLNTFNEDGSFYSGNQLSEENFRPGLTTVDSAGQGLVTAIVSRLNSKYGADIKIQEGAIFPAFSMTYTGRDGARQHELEVMRDKVKNLVNSRGTKDKNGRPTGQLMGMSVDEIMLGLVGFGQQYGGSFAEDAVIDNLPDALVEKFMAAGFLLPAQRNNQKWSPVSTFPAKSTAFYIARELSDKFRAKDSDGSYRTLFGEMEYIENVRMGTFYESSTERSLNMTPKDGVFEDMRSLRPGAMLYNGSTGEFVMLGGRAMFKKDSLQRPTGEALYTLVKMSNSKGGISTHMELKDRAPVYYSLAQLQALNVHVVPRTWELLAGFKDSKKGVQIFNDFEMGNGLQALADKNSIKEVANKSGNTELEKAAYSRIITDATGKQFLISFDVDHHPSIFAVRTADDLSLTITRSPMDVAHDVLANEEFRKLAKNLSSAELGSEKKQKIFDQAEDMMNRILNDLVAEKKLDAEGRWAVEETIGKRLEDLLYERGNHEDLRSGIELGEFEEADAPATQEKGQKEGDEDSFEDRDANQGISKVGNQSLVEDASQAFVEDMIYFDSTVIGRDAIARSLVLRGPAMMQAEEVVHALQNYVAELKATVKSLTAGQKKHEKTLSWHRYVSMERQVLLIERELLPKAMKDLEKAIQNRNFVSDMQSHADRAAQIFAKSAERDAKGKKILETEESIAEREQKQTTRDAIVAAVLDFELDTALLSSGYKGYFSALPRRMQDAAHAVFANQKIAAAMNEGRMSKTIRGLFDGGQENLALYILSGMSAMPDLSTQTEKRLNTDMARIAYAIMSRDIPLPTKKVEGKAGLMKMSELSDADRSLAETLLHLAPSLIAYQREYERAQKDKEGWTAELLWMQQGKTNQGQNKTDLALMIKRTGLSRIFKMNDKKLAALAEGKLEHNTHSLDAYELLLGIAKQYMPADIGPGMLGFSLEDRQEFLNSIEVRDVTKKSANFPDQTSLNETEFRQQLDESLVDFVLDNWKHGNSWMQSVAKRLEAIVDKQKTNGSNVSSSSTALAELMEILKEGGLDPEQQLIDIAYSGLKMDQKENFNVKSLDDIVSFRTQDGLREYNLETENERLTNAEVYPAFEAATMTGADHAMLEIINVIDPGSYKIKVNRQANTGRTPSISVNGIEGGIDFGEKTLSAFGHALMAQIQSLHAEALDPHSVMSQARRKHIITSTYKALSALTEGERARYSGKFRYRQVGKAYVLAEEHVPAEYTLLEKAQAILSELNVLTGLNIPVIIHGPNVSAKDMLEKADRQVEAFPLDLISLYEVASSKGKNAMQATESLKNLMGFKDRLGRIHVFVGAHANALGEFDMQEFSKTIYHEAVGHIGLRKVLGAEYENFMVSVAKRQWGDRVSGMSRDLMIHHAEEFMAHMAEQVVYDAAAGRVVNKNLGTALDRIAAMLARAFRKLMTKLGFNFHVTMFEMRETLSYAFEGSKVAGRSGMSSFISPSLISGENLTHPGEFGRYQPNLMDSALLKTADYLGRWEALHNSVIGAGQTLTPDQDFIDVLRTQKSTIGGLSKEVADKLLDEFKEMFRGHTFVRKDVAEVSEALAALEWNKKRKTFSGISDKVARQTLANHVAKGHLIINADGTYSGSIMKPVRHLVEVNKKTIEFALAGGMITQTKADELLKGFDYYVPLAGNTGLERGSEEYFAISGGNRFSEPGDNFVGLPAQEGEKDSVGLTFAGLNARIAEFSINRTRNVIRNFAGRIGQGNKDLFTVYLSQKEIEAIMEDQNFDIDGMLDYMDNNGLKHMSDIRRMEGLTRNELKQYEMDNGLVPFYKNGELGYFKINDAGLAKSFSMLNNPVQAGRTMRFFGLVTRWLVKMNVGLNPEFFAPNQIKDVGTAWNTLSIKETVAGMPGTEFANKMAALIPDVMKVIYAVNFNKDTSGFTERQKLIHSYMKSFVSSGAKIQWSFMETPDQIVRNLDAAINVAQGTASVKEKAAAFTNGVEEFMRKASDIFENSTRLAIFVTAMEAGSPIGKAALLARETTVDFDRKGEWGQSLNTLYMFANAGIQGTLAVLRAMRHNPGRAAKRVGAIIGFSFSVAMMNMLMGGNGDDDEPTYFGINSDTRNNHFIMMIPGFEQGVRIPLPWVYSFFWAIGQEVAESMFGRKSAGKAGLGMMSALMTNFNPIETSAGLDQAHGWMRMVSPTLFDPAVDIYFEKTPFGTPLMPDKAYDDQPDSARHWRSVSAGSKAVAQWVNSFGGSGATEGYFSVSPETLDYVMETAFGGTGRFLTRTASLPFLPFSAKEMTPNDVPIGRRFAVSTMQWEDRSKFKSAYDEIHGVNRTMKTLQENIGMAKTPELRAQSVEDAAEFRKSNQHILALRVPVNNIYNQVKTIDKQKERLYKSGLSENEIQPQLKILNERQAKIYQAFNKRYFEVVDSR